MDSSLSQRLYLKLPFGLWPLILMALALALDPRAGHLGVVVEEPTGGLANSATSADWAAA